MYPWQDERRRLAAIDEQNRVNEEMAETSRYDNQSRGGLGYLLFIAAVVFFKPIAEYCIELYNTGVEHLDSLTGIFGF